MDFKQILGMVLGGDGNADGKGYSRKFIAVAGAIALHFSGFPLTREMWLAIGAYVIGQSTVDAFKKS